jgi:hypothetical protein
MLLVLDKHPEYSWKLDLVRILDVITIVIIMAMTTCFLLSAYMKPGYVTQELDMIDMLKIGNDKNIDLENFCFYCKVIKSVKTFHCMICG